jgi:L-fuconolactonase
VNLLCWGRLPQAQAVALLTYKQGVDAFRDTDRLSDSDKAMLMGGALQRVYEWSPKRT